MLVPYVMDQAPGVSSHCLSNDVPMLKLPTPGDCLLYEKLRNGVNCSPLPTDRSDAMIRLLIRSSSSTVS